MDFFFGLLTFETSFLIFFFGCNLEFEADLLFLDFEELVFFRLFFSDPFLEEDSFLPEGGEGFSSLLDLESFGSFLFTGISSRILALERGWSRPSPRSGDF